MEEPNYLFIAAEEIPVETSFDIIEATPDSDEALDIKARSPERVEGIVPYVDLNFFTTETINTYDEADELVKEIRTALKEHRERNGDR